MNHQPFRDWLLSEEKLSPEQQQMRQEHLESCAPCRETEAAWMEVESTFRRAPQLQPSPGFTTRWETHLAAYKMRKQKLHSWVSILLTATIVTGLFGLLVSQLWVLLKAPDIYIALWLDRFVNLISIYLTLQDFFTPVNLSIPVFSLIGIIFFIGITSFMCVLWLATYQKLSTARRII